MRAIRLTKTAGGLKIITVAGVRYAEMITLKKRRNPQTKRLVGKCTRDQCHGIVGVRHFSRQNTADASAATPKCSASLMNAFHRHSPNEYGNMFAFYFCFNFIIEYKYGLLAELKMDLFLLV